MLVARTSELDFAVFTEAVNKWQQTLGLTEWDIQLRHDKTDALASTYTNNEGRVATIILGKTWPNDPITQERVQRAALHEVLHILLSDMAWIGESRFIGTGEMTVAEHSVVRRLERALG